MSFYSHREIVASCSLPWYQYQVDPYIGCEHRCHYCYAQNDAETDWEREIKVHTALKPRLLQETAALEPQLIYMGMNSDPYQPAEAQLHQTRKVLEVLVEKEFSVCILTKSSLVTRDIDLFSEMPGTSVGVSIAFNDEYTRKRFEPKAPPNDERIEALKRLKDAGIETYVMICPVMPFLTDVQRVMERVAPYADTIWVYKLSMHSEKDKNWQKVYSILQRDFPEIAEQFQEIVFSDSHPYWDKIREDLVEICKDTVLEVHV